MTSRSLFTNCDSRSVLSAAITPAAFPPIKIGTPQNDRALRGGTNSTPQSRPHLFQVALDQQRLSRPDDVLGKSTARLPRALRKYHSTLNLQLETNLVLFQKRDIESAGVENLSQFHLHRAQHFVLVEMRTDGLPDLRQQFIFLRPPLRFM
ncbi:MAG: hypothetical protein WBV31_14985, partial [Terriglobales bacterium]